MTLPQGVCENPRILAEQVFRLTTRIPGVGTRPTGVFPFRLGRQSIPRPLQVIGSYLHALGVLAFLVSDVAPMLLRDPLPLTQPVAIRRRVVPRHPVHRAVARGCKPLLRMMVRPKAEILLHRDLL